ncbi:MAG: OmpH family outer membrane protein [Cyclobacteriaceae bacterium]
MKKSILLILLFCVSTWTLSAQDIKIGYLDLDQIFANMPEMIAADSLARAYEQELQASLNAKYQDYQVKLEAYQAEGQSMDEVLKQDAEKELQDMQAQLEQFRANANQAIGKKKQELLVPLRTKVREAIDKIAESSNYTHIFSTDGSLVYVKDESTDLSEAVAKELGYTLGGEK